eukprot:761782-Hanusia_phi.AAC.6
MHEWSDLLLRQRGQTGVQGVPASWSISAMISLVSQFGEKWKSPKPAGFEEWTDSIQQTRRGLPDGRTPVSKQPPAAQRHVFYVSSARNSPSSSTSSMVADPGRKVSARSRAS